MIGNVPHPFSGRRYGGPVLLAISLCLLFGCGANPRRLYCGAGIRPPVAELVEEFSRQHGVTIECDYRGSEMLLSTVKLSGQGDLFMPGDEHYVDLADQAGLIASKKNVCYFVPVILVQKGNPKGVFTLADLARPDIKVGLGDPQTCAVGRKSAQIFQKGGIDEQSIHVVVRTATVNELSNHVKLGTLDAAIVWDAVAAFAPEETEPVRIPVEQNVISTVSIGVLRFAKYPDTAQKFVEFVTSDRGKEVFRKHHYSTELPE